MRLYDAIVNGAEKVCIFYFALVFISLFVGYNFHLAFQMEDRERYRFGGREMVYFHENCDKSFCEQHYYFTYSLLSFLFRRLNESECVWIFFLVVESVVDLFFFVFTSNVFFSIQLYTKWFHSLRFYTDAMLPFLLPFGNNCIRNLI